MSLINLLDSPSRTMERAFLDVFDDLDFRLARRNGLLNGAPVPSVDISEDSDNFYVIAEIPGLDEKDVKVTVDNDTITISGDKERKEETSDRNYYRMERSFGQFVRSLSLPPNVKSNAISGRFRDGLLELTLPKVATEASTAREIPLNNVRSESKRLQHNGRKVAA